MKLLFLTIIIVLIINPAWSKTEESTDYSPISSQLVSYVAERQPEADSSPSLSQSTSTKFSKASGGTSIKRSDQGVYVQSTEEDLQPSITESIKIRKIIIPKAENETIHLGELAKVKVEIYSNSKEDITFDLIEFIDKNLAVFYPSVNGYILPDITLISYYEQDILEYLECDRVMANLNTDNSISFNYSNLIVNNAINKKITLKPINENPINEIPFLENRSPIFKWNDIDNGSLAGQQNYKELCSYLVDRLQALDNKEIGRCTINKTDNKIIIYKNESPIINISRSDDYFMNKGYISLICNNNVFHLRIEDEYVYDTNNILAFDNVTLHPGDLLVFWYCIKPMVSGQFDAETLVYISNSRPKQAIFYPVTVIAENNPLFRATRTIHDYQKYLDDNLEIVYNVDYMGGGTTPQIKNVDIYFDKSDEYEYIDIDGNKLNESMKKNPHIIKSFSLNQSEPIKLTIKLIRTGIVSPPGFKINGNNKHFEDTITVDKPTWRFSNFFSLLITGVAFLFIFIFSELYLKFRTNRDDLCLNFIVKSRRDKISYILRNAVAFILISLIIIIMLDIIFSLLIRLANMMPFI